MPLPILSRILLSLGLAASLAGTPPPPPVAPQAPVAPKAPPAPPALPVPPEPDYSSLREFKGRLFTVQHKSAYQLRDVLRPLTSGAKGAVIEATEREGLKTLSVRDFPENVAAVEAALKRLDVPAPAPKEVELHIHVLFASRQEGPSEALPEELREVLKPLKATLNYRSYTLAASFVQRSASGSERLGGRGQTEMHVNAPKGERGTVPVGLDWAIAQLRLEPAAAGPGTLVLTKFEFTGWERVNNDSRDLARLRTDLSLKDGEKVVVGTSTIQDKGLIVVLTAKVLP